MEAIRTLVLTGYRSFELSVFKEDDPKVTIIKKVLKNRLLSYLEEGLEWVLISGNLGTELWGGETVLELQAEFPELHLGIVFPYQAFGQQWKKNNQAKLAKLTAQADFVDSVSHQPYQNPQQLKNHTQFLLTHSDGVLLLFDEEFSGKPQFFYQDARRFSEKNPYQIDKITMDDLQNAISE